MFRPPCWLFPANYLYWYHHGDRHRYVVEAPRSCNALHAGLHRRWVRRAVVETARISLIVGVLIALVVVRTLSPTDLSAVSTSSASLIAATATTKAMSAAKTAALVTVAVTASSMPFLDGEGIGLPVGLFKDVLVPHVWAVGLVVVL